MMMSAKIDPITRKSNITYQDILQNVFHINAQGGGWAIIVISTSNKTAGRTLIQGELLSAFANQEVRQPQGAHIVSRLCSQTHSTFIWQKRRKCY